MKICTKCLIEKKVSEFHKDAKKSNGLASKCKDCAHIDRVKRYSNTKEKSIEYSKIWAINNPELTKKYQKDFIFRNPNFNKEQHAKNYKNNKQKVLDMNSLWQKNNRATCKARLAKYRATKKNATPLWANIEEIKKIYKLTVKLHMITGEIYEVDHIIPLQNDRVCGLHCEANLQVITQNENRCKSNRINYGSYH